MTTTLKQKWEALKNSDRPIRIRNAAEELGVTEVELLATQCGENVTRLRPEFQKILQKVTNFGYVMALTRNDHMVHERKGHYLNPELENPHVGLFVGEDIDLRIFFSSWGSAYSVHEMTGDKPRYSLQFFGKDGEAIHKIYLQENSNYDAYQNIIDEFKSEDQRPTQSIEPKKAADKERPDGEIDREGFQKEWSELKDTHHFFGLIKKYGLSRTQALRLAPNGDYAVAVDNSSLRKLLEGAAKSKLPIMVFVGNQGMIQIHTGPVERLVDVKGWYNVLDPEFNLHIREAGIKSSWIVRKPTEDGMVTALECYDEAGIQLVQLFGKRKPGIPELEAWRELVKKVEENNRLQKVLF